MLDWNTLKLYNYLRLNHDYNKKEIVTLNHKLVHEFLVLGRNNQNHTTICKSSGSRMNMCLMIDYKRVLET